MSDRTIKHGQDLRALRSANTTVLLAAIRNHSPVSRSALAQLTGLAPASITRLARTLTDAGLIREASKGQSSGGRQPTLLALNEHAGLVVGIDLSGPELRGRVADVSGAAVAELKRPFGDRGPDALLREVTQFIDGLLIHPAVSKRRILGIGVSIPGTVDSAMGTVIDSTPLQVTNLALGPVLEQRYGVPVVLEHDTAAAALAEQSYGAGLGVPNLVYVTLSGGIGAGIIVAGDVYHGETGAAGELGHTIVDRDGPLCPCGRRGCLETFASSPAIVASARRLLDQGGTTLLRDAAPQRLSMETIIVAAQRGDDLAQALLANAADYVALALSTLVCILDIRLVILGGEVAQAGAVFFAPVQHALARYQLSSNVPRIVPAQLGDAAASIGVSMVTVAHLLHQVQREYPGGVPA